MLQTTPVHHENYSRLILSVVIQFYQRCSDRYKDLVTLSLSSDIGEPQIALAAQWAQRSDLSPCLSELAITQVSHLLMFTAAHFLTFCRNQRLAVYLNSPSKR